MFKKILFIFLLLMIYSPILVLARTQDVVSGQHLQFHIKSLQNKGENIEVYAIITKNNNKYERVVLDNFKSVGTKKFHEYSLFFKEEFLIKAYDAKYFEIGYCVPKCKRIKDEKFIAKRSENVKFDNYNNGDNKDYTNIFSPIRPN